MYLTQFRSRLPKFFTLQWRHNERNGVSNHQPRNCLLNCLFRHRWKKTSKLRVTGLCEGNSPVTGGWGDGLPPLRCRNDLMGNLSYPRITSIGGLNGLMSKSPARDHSFKTNPSKFCMKLFLGVLFYLRSFVVWFRNLEFWHFFYLFPSGFRWPGGHIIVRRVISQNALDWFFSTRDADSTPGWLMFIGHESKINVTVSENVPILAILISFILDHTFKTNIWNRVRKCPLGDCMT